MYSREKLQPLTVVETYPCDVHPVNVDRTRSRFDDAEEGEERLWSL